MPALSARVLLLPLSLLVAAAGCTPTESAAGNNGGGGAGAVAGTGGAAAGGASVGSGGAQPGTGGAGTGGAPATGSGGASPAGGQTGGGGAATGGSSGSGGGNGGATGATGGGAGTSSGGRGGGQGGALGQAGAGGALGQAGAGGAPMHREFILYDDADGQLLYVNNANPSANWTVSSGTGRDMQLIGGGRVMLGKSDGWDEYRLSDGMRVTGQHGYAGTQTAHRMADGNTILASVSGTNIVLKFVNVSGQMQRQVTYAGFSYVRMVRPTSTGTYLVTADTVAFEGNDQGMVLSRVNVAGGNHTWKAMRMSNGNVAVTSGYSATLLIYDSAWRLLQTIGGKNQPNAAAIAPWFFADFHVMPNGNFFVVNSQADRTMDNSIQLLEYNPAGTLVWQQKQPTGIHSLEEAIILDGLDTTKLHIQPQGLLIPAP